jgi:hypothetical protein
VRLGSIALSLAQDTHMKQHSKSTHENQGSLFEIDIPATRINKIAALLKITRQFQIEPISRNAG